MLTNNLKSEAIRIVNSLPDTATWYDLARAIDIRQSKVSLEDAEAVDNSQPISSVHASNLDQLLSRITPENLPDAEDIEWGRPMGSEPW